MIYATFFVLVTLAVFSTVNTNADEGAEASRCPLNEVIRSCGKTCEDRCNSPRPRTCATLVCLHTECRCKDGFFRNPYTNRCVISAECPNDGCARGEILGRCGRRCEGTCERPTEPDVCKKISCPRQCRCDLQGGFVRNPMGLCVRAARC